MSPNSSRVEKNEIFNNYRFTIGKILSSIRNLEMFVFGLGHFGHSLDGSIVYYSINWEVTFKVGPYAGIPMKTRSNVQKIMKDGKIVEKYHTFSVPQNAVEALEQKLTKSG